MAEIHNSEVTKHSDIQVRGLRVRYAGLEVLHGVDLTVERGEFVTIVGKSGSGKSTLLHALAGFISRQGEIRIPPDIGFVFQDYAVFPWLTVKENVAFGLHGMTRPERDKLISKYLALVGLTSHADNYPAELSGGQAQRVAVARTFAPGPEVVLMDEPFGALDAYTRERMQTWLLDIWESNHNTMLFVTHSIEEALFLSDRVIVLGRGMIVGEFPIPFKRPRSEKIKFAASFVALKEEVVNAVSIVDEH